MVRISATVMSHPARRDSAQWVQAQISDLDAILAIDPKPDGPPSALRAARIAWKSADPRATHHLVIQDDVAPTRDFVAELYKAVEQRPNDILSLFCDWGSRTGQAARTAAWTGFSYAAIVNSSVDAKAVVMPTSLALEFSQFLMDDPDGRDSRQIAEFARQKHKTPLVTVPNLIDHDVRGTESLWATNLDKGPRRCSVPIPPRAETHFTSPDVYLPDVVCYLSTERLASQMSAVESLRALSRTKTTEYPFPSSLKKEELARRFLDSPKPPDKLTQLVAPAHLFQTWVTAYVSGYLISDDASVALHADNAISLSAAATLTFGSLRRVLAERCSVDVNEWSADWVMEAVHDGYSTIASLPNH